MLSGFDILLIIAALTVLICGMLKRYRLWRRGKPQSLDGNNKTIRLGKVIKSVLGHQKVLEDIYGGIAHLFIFWGFIVPLLLVVIGQFRTVVDPAWAQWGSLLLDILGMLALTGTGMMLYKGLKDGRGKKEDHLIHLWTLLAILITGFLAEGTRLKIVETNFPYNLLSSPVGFAISYLMPASPLLLKLMIRSHFFLVLFFIGGLPFTVMRHAIAGTMNLYYQELEPQGIIEHLALEGERFGTGKIDDFTWKNLLFTDACMSCGRCERSCPAFISGQPLSPRIVVRELGKRMAETHAIAPLDIYEQIRLVNEDGAFGGENIWCCTTCLGCVESCPVLVKHPDIIVGMRRHAVLTEATLFPSEYKKVFKNTEIFGDTLGKGSLFREDWALNLNVKRIYNDPKVEMLFWVGCMGALYDERTRNKTVKACRILEKAGVDFGILGKEERCCGDSARRMGNEYLFQELARQNIQTLKKYNVKKIVTFCPHGFHVFKNEYPQFGADFEVLHFTQLIKILLDEGKLKIQSKLDGLFTYHDPCYMGRYNNLYKTPRDLLDALLISDLKEMAHSKKGSFCCGAGGGNFWRVRVVGRRMETLRIEEAIGTNTSGVITACPFCEIMLESAANQKGLAHSFNVMDILELVNQVT
jgi:Fe-S oxidoreductase/nitrate reductase gamma subunit